MRKILTVVGGLGILFGLWQLGLHWLGPTVGIRGHNSADQFETKFADQFESKFKEIQLDMSEKNVDQILAGYRCERRELAEDEKEEPPNPYGYWKLKRKASFVKTYGPRVNEGDFYIQLYFDDNYSVVGRLLVKPPKDEFTRKYLKIQLEMTEEQVDQILAGYPCERRDVYDIEKDQALWPGGKHKRKASFVKTYNSKHGANEGDFYISVYFDDNYYVVGKVMGEYIS
jgi:hypothetical protein